MKQLHYVLSGVSKISIVGADFSTPFPKTQRRGFIRCIFSGSRPVSRDGAVIEAIKYRRLSRYKIRKIILYFTGDITASFVSKILHINRKTINAYYNEIREKILHHSLKEQAKELGEFELDENCFGARGVCEKKRARCSRQSTVAIATEFSVMERICVRKIIRQRHWVL